MDHLRLSEANNRLDRARAEYSKALAVEHQAVQSDRVKLAIDEYNQALDAFMKFIVKESPCEVHPRGWIKPIEQ